LAPSCGASPEGLYVVGGRRNHGCAADRRAEAAESHRADRGVMYGVVTEVPAPVELYDAAHAAIGQHSGAKIDGLLVHIGRSTSSGFQVIEIWESQEHFDRYNRDVVGLVMANLAQGQPAPAVPPPVEFDVRGLVIPAANLYH
jgi:hypothetical protein